MFKHPSIYGSKPRLPPLTLGLLLLLLLLWGVSPGVADAQTCSVRTQHRDATETQVRFVNIAAEDSLGITYRRGPSNRNEIFDAFKAQPLYSLEDLGNTPIKSRGAPGVVLFDFDVDGDLDIFVTNGPGRSNSLYANRLVEEGRLEFVDIAGTTRVGFPEMDASGVCFGDIDNDGFQDLVILDSARRNRLLRNVGNGTFQDMGDASGVPLPDGRASTSCAFGDIDADGYLDLVIGNAFALENQLPLASESYALNQPNQLLRNRGDGTFEDVTATRGIDAPWLPSAPKGAGTITWAVALVDIDLDGDVDLVHADDQGAIPALEQNGIDRGMIQVFDNDGAGFFTATTAERGLNRPGSWGGLSFGDYDRNGRLDLFATNYGGGKDSRWFLQGTDGVFADSATTTGQTYSPHGWGTSSVDYDNDGDTDIIFHGGFDTGLQVLMNPGGLLRNDGASGFHRDSDPFFGSADHLRRTIHGVAVGDIDLDGFPDIVTVSNFEMLPVGDYPLTIQPSNGGEWDLDSFVLETFVQTEVDPVGFEWQGYALEEGTLAIELNTGNPQNWLQVQVLGGKGRIGAGRVNRDGIGATVIVTPRFAAYLKPSVLLPILGGSSHASQDSLVAQAGLGKRNRADIEVLWPGGVRNKLYDALGCQVLRFPEIPCSFDDRGLTRSEYRACVQTALSQWRQAGELDAAEVDLYFRSALRAYDEAR